MRPLAPKARLELAREEEVEFPSCARRAEPVARQRVASLAGKDPEIVGLYLSAADRAVALCIDGTDPDPPTGQDPRAPTREPRLAERRACEPVGPGTTSLFEDLEATCADAVVGLDRRRRAAGLVEFLDRVDDAVPGRYDVDLVLDYDEAHGMLDLDRWVDEHPRFHVDFAPANGSWLSLVERCFTSARTSEIRRDARRGTRPLEGAIVEHLTLANEHPAPFVWAKPGVESRDQNRRESSTVASRGRVTVAQCPPSIAQPPHRTAGRVSQPRRPGSR